MNRHSVDWVAAILAAFIGTYIGGLIVSSPSWSQQPLVDTIVEDLKCPGDIPACKDEACHFENKMEITIVNKKIDSAVIKWKKSSTSQCCKADRDFRKGSLTFTYSDGSKPVEVTPASYGDPAVPWPPGITWTNPDGTDATPIPPPAAGTPAPATPAGKMENGAPREPAGFTFDPKKAGKDLAAIKVDYGMTLSCTCIGSKAATKKATKPWSAFTAFDLESQKFTHPGQ